MIINRKKPKAFVPFQKWIRMCQIPPISGINLLILRITEPKHYLVCQKTSSNLKIPTSKHIWLYQSWQSHKYILLTSLLQNKTWIFVFALKMPENHQHANVTEITVSYCNTAPTTFFKKKHFITQLICSQIHFLLNKIAPDLLIVCFGVISQ